MYRTIRSKLAVSLAFVIYVAARSSQAAPTDSGLEQIARPFFNQHCVSCHGEKKQKGDLRLDTLSVQFDSPKIMGHWMEIMDRINSGDMPPKKEARPKGDDIAKVTEWISGQLREADASRQSTVGEAITFHKLSREEYANTIHDLLGVQFDVTDPTGLPEDPDWQGFQRIGSVLTLSATHIEKYMAAADMVLSEALSIGPQPACQITHWNPYDMRYNGFRKEYEARGIGDKVRIDLVPNNGALDVRDFKTTWPGMYKCRVKLSGLRPPGGRPPRLRLYAGDISRTLYEHDIEAPEDQPIVVEFTTHLPAGIHPIRVVNAVPGPNPEARRSRASGTAIAFTTVKARVPWQIKFTDDDYKPIIPSLLIDYIEWEGPIIESWPTPAHKQVFFGGEKATKDSAYARQIITRFAERAFRHPVEEAEMERLIKLAEKAQTLGDTFEGSIKTALTAVLCSKSFLYLEQGKPSMTGAEKLSDYELASRLSYFLWSSMPDQPLLDLAKQGKLHEPSILREQTKRMLADPRSAEFANDFPRQWLQLRRVGMFQPDKILYPDYDESLEQSMVAESLGCFREVLDKNLSLREFLDSKWTFLNERLASHYGIEGVHGDEMRRVELKPEDHRGGVLTHGSVLSLTSDGTRHRPVHRGVWVYESILGKPAPIPPANVPPLNTPDPGAPKTTLRAKLEAHRAEPTCNACHRKIDPMGMAFDNYDAIGRWRTHETLKDGAGADPKLDPSGELPDGRSFTDANSFKKLLLDDSDKFAMAFTEKLATFALRRGMTYSDRLQLKKVAAAARENDYRLDTLIEDLVGADLFQRR